MMISFIKRIMCRHEYEFVKLRKPFYGYPIYDNHGFWVKDIYLHTCIKCGKCVWFDDIKEGV